MSLGGVGAFASQISPPTGRAPAQLLVGTVVASPTPTADRVWVQIYEGFDAIPLPYQASYVPVAGDVVSVLLIGEGNSSGIVLDGRQAQSGNLVVNPNFYRAPILTFPIVNAPPYNWYRYLASGTASLFAQIFHSTALRFIGNVSAPGGGAASDTYVYSAAIPVSAGANYYLTTAGHASVFVSSALTVQSRVAWFADATFDYPSYSSETQFGTNALGASTETDIYHFGTLTPPDGATYARVVMRQSWSGALPGGNMMWAEIVMLPA